VRPEGSTVPQLELNSNYTYYAKTANKEIGFMGLEQLCIAASGGMGKGASAIINARRIRHINPVWGALL